MRSLSLVLALVAMTQPALATGLAETLVDPEVIVEEVANPGSGGFIIPLLILAAVVAISTHGSDPVPVPVCPELKVPVC